MIISRQEKSTETLFNKESLAWLVVIVTAFLQLISLMTTFNGSIVYFGGINLPLGISAPLLFALAIQLTVFAVSHTIRHQFNNGLIIVLLLATLCSTYFSYIGIYNYINSPINYLAERYEMIEQNLTDKYEKLREDNKGTMRENMALIINEIRTSHETLEMKITSNEQQSNRLATINVDDNNIKSQTNTVAKPDINNYGNDLASYYADMESEIKSAAYLLNGMYDEENKINLQDEEYEIDNLYVLPIYNLVKANEGRNWHGCGTSSKT